MIVSIIYAAIAGIALVVLALIWREFLLDRRAATRDGNGGSAGIMASLLVVVMGAFVITDAIELVAGLGSVVKVTILVWALLLSPFVKLAAAGWIWRLRQRALGAVTRESAEKP